MRKVYPLALDPKVYANLKALADCKGITIKEALRQAIALLISDNLTMLTLTTKKTIDASNTDGNQSI